MLDAPHPEATLKETKGLEYWEWHEGGVLKIELTGKGVLEDYEADALGGELIEKEHFALIATEDCDIYKPRSNDLLAMFDAEETDEDRLLISLRKGVIPQDLCELGLKCLRDAATVSDNRGMAGGKVDRSKLRAIARDGEIRESGRGTRVQYKLPDGTWSTTTAANKVMSGIAGNFDASPRIPYCRQTGYDRSHPGPMTEVIPFLEAISNRFKAQAPIRWQRQKDFVDDTSIFPNGWCLGDTVFTTITVNRNWRTAVHKDAGDFPGGYGNITVLEGGPHPYEGGYTGFPKYRIAADVRQGDFMAMDVHEWHGNTKMAPTVPCPDPEGWDDPADPKAPNHGFERVSVVCYARYGMKECGSQEEEKAKYQKFISKFKSPKKVQQLQLQARQEAKEQENAELSHLQSLFPEEE